MLISTTLKTGSGLPLVFLHGFLGTSADWEPLCSYLPPCSCIGFDLPGHGKSPFLKSFTIPLPRFHLIGYSMGGRLSMMYAKNHPDQVASLTILSAHPGLKTEAERKLKLENDTKWARLLLELPFEAFLDRWYDQPLFRPFKPKRTPQNTQSMADALIYYSLAHQPVFEIDTALVGERDEKYRALFKCPVIIPDAGHAIHLENPKATAEVLSTKISFY